MRVDSFADIAEEFHARTARIAWATVATVGADGAPRTRILHPIWEDHVGWIATTSNSTRTGTTSIFQCGCLCMTICSPGTRRSSG